MYASCAIELITIYPEQSDCVSQLRAKTRSPDNQIARIKYNDEYYATLAKITIDVVRSVYVSSFYKDNENDEKASLNLESPSKRSPKQYDMDIG